MRLSLYIWPANQMKYFLFVKNIYLYILFCFHYIYIIFLFNKDTVYEDSTLVWLDMNSQENIYKFNP